MVEQNEQRIDAGSMYSNKTYKMLYDIIYAVFVNKCRCSTCCFSQNNHCWIQWSDLHLLVVLPLQGQALSNLPGQVAAVALWERHTGTRGEVCRTKTICCKSVTVPIWRVVPPYSIWNSWFILVYYYLKNGRKMDLVGVSLFILQLWELVVNDPTFCPTFRAQYSEQRPSLMPLC